LNYTDISMTKTSHHILQLVSLFLGVITLVSIILISNFPSEHTVFKMSIPFFIYTLYIITLILDIKLGKLFENKEIIQD